VQELGGTLTTTDAGFDAKTQTDQIDSLIASKPDALFITPADAVAIAPAVQRAITAGIPVFCADSAVPRARPSTISSPPIPISTLSGAPGTVQRWKVRWQPAPPTSRI
jgi:ribose transport system substrate-binding protein